MKPIQLKYDCPEKWENMKIGMISRHCTNCNKDVHDFTQFTREQIIDFLLKNKVNQVCARVYKSQLDFSREEMLISINHIIRKNKNPNYALYLMFISSLLLSSCDSEKDYLKSLSQKIQKIIPDLSNLDKIDTNNSSKIYDQGQMILGEIGFRDTIPLSVRDSNLLLISQYYPNYTILDTNIIPIIFPDQMPEYVGGIDSFFAYIQSKSEITLSQTYNPIYQRVNIAFIIDKNGNLLYPQILNANSENNTIAKILLNLLNYSPKWKPGKNNDQNCDVLLSINFNVNQKY